MTRTFRADTRLEALVLEHALVLARQLQQAADAAPDGAVLARVEAAAVPAGRRGGAAGPGRGGRKRGAPGRACPGGHKAAWPKRRAARNVPTAAGVVRLDRLYLVCPRCQAGRHPLDDRLGVAGSVSPAARRLLCLAGASWSFDRAAAHLKELCGLAVGANTIRRVCHGHGGAARDWRRGDPAAAAAFRAAGGDVEFQTDGTAVNTTAGWRELRLTARLGVRPRRP